MKEQSGHIKDIPKKKVLPSNNHNVIFQELQEGLSNVMSEVRVHFSLAERGWTDENTKCRKILEVKLKNF